MTPAVLTPSGFAAAQQADLERLIEVNTPSSWAASMVGNPCDRALVWSFTRPTERAPYGYILQSIFNEGKLHHADSYERLERMGFILNREARRSVRYKLGGGAVVSGRMDGSLRGFKDQRFNPDWSLEIKSVQEQAWRRYDTIEDVYAASHWRTAGYGDQINIYNFLEELPAGVLVFKSKSTGLLKVIPAPLDYGRAEQTLQRIERLQGMVDRKEDPPPILYGDTTCGQCPFLAVCYPAKDYGAGMIELPVGDEFVAQLAREQELKAAHSEYDKLTKARSKTLRMLGTFEFAAVGPFVIRRKEVPVKGFTVAPRTDVRFEITRVDEPKQIEEEANGKGREGTRETGEVPA